MRWIQNTGGKLKKKKKLQGQHILSYVGALGDQVIITITLSMLSIYFSR